MAMGRCSCSASGGIVGRPLRFARFVLVEQIGLPAAHLISLIASECRSDQILYRVPYSHARQTPSVERSAVWCRTGSEFRGVMYYLKTTERPCNPDWRLIIFTFALMGEQPCVAATLGLPMSCLSDSLRGESPYDLTHTSQETRHEKGTYLSTSCDDYSVCRRCSRSGSGQTDGRSGRDVQITGQRRGPTS